MRRRAHILFPILSTCMVVLILTSLFYIEPFALLYRNAFARFCMFWLLAVFTVLAFSNRVIRPSTVAIAATAIAIVVGAAFCLIFAAVAPALFNFSDVLLSCLAGAILGALAGTWLIYVLEVYARR